jgi:hypothetical protein
MKDRRLKEVEEEIGGKAIPHYIQPLLTKMLRIMTDQDREIRKLKRRAPGRRLID